MEGIGTGDNNGQAGLHPIGESVSATSPLARGAPHDMESTRAQEEKPHPLSEITTSSQPGDGTHETQTASIPTAAIPGVSIDLQSGHDTHTVAQNQEGVDSQRIRSISAEEVVCLSLEDCTPEDNQGTMDSQSSGEDEDVLFDMLHTPPSLQEDSSSVTRADTPTSVGPSREEQESNEGVADGGHKLEAQEEEGSGLSPGDALVDGVGVSGVSGDGGEEQVQLTEACTYVEQGGPAEAVGGAIGAEKGGASNDIVVGLGGASRDTRREDSGSRVGGASGETKEGGASGDVKVGGDEAVGDGASNDMGVGESIAEPELSDTVSR